MPEAANASLNCLAGAQPDPPQPGRTDDFVTGCPVCNASFPCLFDILSDPSEYHNVAGDHPEVVVGLAEKVAELEPYYVTGSLSEEELNRTYEAIDPSEWSLNGTGFYGPCYRRKLTELGSTVLAIAGSWP